MKVSGFKLLLTLTGRFGSVVLKSRPNHLARALSGENVILTHGYVKSVCERSAKRTDFNLRRLLFYRGNSRRLFSTESVECGRSRLTAIDSKRRLPHASLNHIQLFLDNRKTQSVRNDQLGVNLAYAATARTASRVELEQFAIDSDEPKVWPSRTTLYIKACTNDCVAKLTP